MACEFITRRRVEFVETDMAGIVHFSNFFRYMEAVEHEFFRSLGVFLHEQEGARLRGYARVHAECDYQQPLRCYDEVEVRLRVAGIGRSSITYSFAFDRVEARGEACAPVRVATGSMTVVCVQRGEGGAALQKAPLPPEITRHLEVAPPASPPAAGSP